MTRRVTGISLLTLVIAMTLFSFVPQTVSAQTYFQLIPKPTGSCPLDPASSQAEPFKCCTSGTSTSPRPVGCTDDKLGTCLGSGAIRGGDDLPCNYSLCDFLQLFVNAMNIIVTISGGVALIILIWGAQGFLMSMGSEEKVTESKNLMKNAAIGLVIILVSWQLVAILINFVAPKFGEVKAQAGFGSWKLLGNVRDLCTFKAP